MPQEPDDQPEKPRDTHPPESNEETSPAAAPRTTSPLVLALGFTLFALLGVLIASTLLPSSKEPSLDSPSLQALRADIESQRAALNRERVTLGLEPIGGPVGEESADAIAARLKTDAASLASLAGGLEDLLARKDLQLDQARAESVAALKEQQRLRTLVATATDDLQRALVDASLATTLKADLDRANQALAARQLELDKLRSQPDELSAKLAASENARLTLESEIASLRNQLARANLFAGTESEIIKEAIALFRALRELEGRSDSEISTAYSQFGARLNANVLQTCDFPTGSADVRPELLENLRRLPLDAPDNSLLFVVGYASETGNVDQNRSLSSQRATAVAEILTAATSPGQQVQAAYVGQTDRFSSRIPERNQIVEVWQVVPKPR